MSVTVYIIDNPTYESDFYKTFKNARVHVYNPDTAELNHFEEADAQIQQIKNISTDHSGLVISSFLHVFGKEKPVDLRLATKNNLSPLEETASNEDLFNDLSEALREYKQWIGFCGANMKTEDGFEVAKKLYNSIQEADVIAQSYVWHQDLKGLEEEEIERNSHFYLPAKSKEIPYVQPIFEEINKVEKKLNIDKEHSLVNLLSNWRKNVSAILRQNPNYGLKEIYMNDIIQEYFVVISNRYKLLQSNTNNETLKRFCQQALLTLQNLRPTPDGKDLTCLALTAEYCEQYARKHSVKEVETLIKKFDDKNIGVFTADSLQNYYKIFPHAFANESDSIPLEVPDDNRVKLLDPNRCLLFVNELSKMPVANSYHGLKSLDKIGRGGVSALIPKLAALFSFCRTLDPDIRVQEFAEIALRSGSLSCIKYQGKKYGGTIPDKKTLSDNVLKYKAWRHKLPTWTNSNKNEKSTREHYFKNFINMLDKKQLKVLEYEKIDNDIKLTNNSLQTYRSYYKHKQQNNLPVYPKNACQGL